MNHTERAREVLDVEIAGLTKVRDALDETFAEAVELLLQSLTNRGKIIVTGIGKCLHVAEKISATLASTGATSVVLHPSQAMHGDLGILAEGDVLLILSYSGQSEELLGLVPIVKRFGVRIVSLTGEPESDLARHSDVSLSVTIEREACPFNMAPTASTTAMLAVGDALAMALLDARGFRKEDYAALHPGGAIGRALLMRVSDIMRTGERLASVQKGARVKDALVAMTKARAGSSAVVDEKQLVIGVFTDGDLRRHVAEQEDLLEQPIETVMTPSPITLTADSLAVEALRIYEERNIDDLLVVDSQGRLVGAVDIQDLPKFKIL